MTGSEPPVRPADAARPWDLHEQLDRVIESFRPGVGGAGVGLMLRADGGALRCVGATDPATAALEHAQTELGCGPGVDAVGLRRTVTVTDVSTDERWPGLSERLSGAGVHAVLSIPIVVDDVSVGTLNLSSEAPRVWAAEEERAARAVGDVVAALLRSSSVIAASREAMSLSEEVLARLDADEAGGTQDTVPGDGP